MKASKIILYIVIIAVIAYLAYKAYTNYQASGSIFDSTPILIGEGGAGSSASRFAFTTRKPIYSRYISAQSCLGNCPKCTWTTNGRCLNAENREIFPA